MRLRFRSVVSREYSELAVVVATGRWTVDEGRSGDGPEIRGDRVSELRKSCTLKAVDEGIDVDAKTEEDVATANDAG